MGLKRATHDEEGMEVSPVAKRRLCCARVVSDAQPCDVCQDEATADDGAVRLGSCGHWMCGSCAGAWCTNVVARCLQQGQPLRCALPGCGRPVPLQQAQQLVEMAGLMDAETGAGYEAAAFIPEDAQFVCPYPDCGVMSEVEAALPDVPSACPSCGRWVCPCCRCMWHAGLRCSQYQAMGASTSTSERRCRVMWRRASGSRQPQQQQQQRRDPTNQQQRDQNPPPTHHFCPQPLAPMSP